MTEQREAAPNGKRTSGKEAPLSPAPEAAVHTVSPPRCPKSAKIRPRPASLGARPRLLHQHSELIGAALRLPGPG